MPTITRTLIKTALGYLLLGMALSVVWMLALVWPLHPILAVLQPTALHLIVVGALTQLIFGVAIWMFPPWTKQQPRGPVVPTWLAYALLNAGLLLRLVAEPLNTYRPRPVWGWLLVGSALLQVAAIWLVVALLWPRVRTKSARS